MNREKITNTTKANSKERSKSSGQHVVTITNNQSIIRHNRNPTAGLRVKQSNDLIVLDLKPKSEN